MVYHRKNKYLKAFGANLHNIRVKKGISQAQLAADCNMEISQISRIERGLLNTGISQVYTISLCLDVKLSILLDIESHDL